MKKRLRLSRHAIEACEQRGLALSWVEITVRRPTWIEPDPHDPTVERRFGLIVERRGRWLRVACRETPDEIFVISCFLDRKARRPA